MEKKFRSLQTRTPEEGFELAIKLSQEAVKQIQPDEKIRKKLRPKYSRDADSIIAATHVVSVNFQTVAAANNYWRSKTTIS
ncbi:MAG TPA: hexameric tyrosine-coordinated heme protein [Candidatus Avamphibacillus sp.]|nr:hexameric tyrosine-coordinated heme protein [Candidatus Avamphibacillus sp.]